MELKINLQLFSEEKTEKATHKIIKDAREKGQVLQSKEINAAFVLLVGFLTINQLSGYLGNNIKDFTIYLYSEYLNSNYLFSIQNINKIVIISFIYFFKMALPIGIICLLIGLIASYMQVGFLFTTKPLAIDFNKLNPVSGFKRLFSMKSIVELIKSIIKIIVVGYVVYKYIISQTSVILNTIMMDMESIIEIAKSITMSMAFRGSLALLIIAILDYAYQKYDYDKNLKMSKQEVKEEFKQMEGNPQIKSKIKEKQRQMAMARMMQDVPTADVVITNPTHFAVAIKYDPNKSDAPIVVAKGIDLIAENIKKIARENDLPIIENKPLARALYHDVEVGESIPPELYQAVAEILAYIYHKNRRF